MEGLEIYTVELYLKVRLACADGMSKRAAARHFNISRDTVDKAVAFSVPPGYRRTVAIKRPKAMRAAFASAAEQAPCILFIDEVDSFGDRARPRDHNSTYTDYILNALLDLLDGFHGHEGVMVMAATNHPDKLDAALIRPGRFDHIVTLDYPSFDRLPAAIRWQLGADLPDADLSGVAVRAAGASGADIAAAVRAARARARMGRRDLILTDLEEALAAARPSLPEALRWRVSVHEAGHAVVEWAWPQA